jgi:hypothetical protein
MSVRARSPRGWINRVSFRRESQNDGTHGETIEIECDCASRAERSLLLPPHCAEERGQELGVRDWATIGGRNDQTGHVCMMGR